MAKQQNPKTKSTTVDMKDGSILKNRNGNFSVTKNGKNTKPTATDSAMYNASVKSANSMQKAIRKPLLADTLKKKK